MSRRPRSITLNGINRAGRNGCKKFQTFCGMNVRVWSREHKAYWRPDGSGYTDDAAAAWVVEFTTAYYCTKHCGPEKHICYVEALT
jgi:hypothetical protein